MGGVASYFLVVKPLLEKLGIKKDKDGIWNNGYGMYGMGSHGCNGMEMKT